MMRLKEMSEELKQMRFEEEEEYIMQMRRIPLLCKSNSRMSGALKDKRTW